MSAQKRLEDVTRLEEDLVKARSDSAKVEQQNNAATATTLDLQAKTNTLETKIQRLQEEHAKVSVCWYIVYSDCQV